MTAEAMVQISKITGREYKPFVYYGDPDAENIIIAMGSVTETIKETVDYLRAKGEKVGVITVHLYRPFSAKYLLNVLPKSVKRIWRARPHEGTGRERRSAVPRRERYFLRSARRPDDYRWSLRPLVERHHSGANACRVQQLESQ